jgi:hypothetical protein
MNEKNAKPCDRDAVLDNFAAELTAAAYPIALQHGVHGSSIDLELQMWKKLTEVVHNHGGELMRA